MIILVWFSSSRIIIYMKNKKLFLLQLCKPLKGYGGIRSYVESVKAIYQRQGYDVYTVGLGKKGMSLGHTDMLTDVAGVLSLAKQYRCIIVFTGYNVGSSSIPKEDARLTLQIGKISKSPLIIHDPNEMSAYVNEYEGPIFTLRRRNQECMKQMFGKETTLLRMPHTNWIREGLKKEKNGKTLSMFAISFRKHPEIILDAIKNYQADVDFYGTYNSGSKLTEYQLLKPKHPDWRDYYKGEYEGDKIDFISQYKFFWDMTAVKNHGGFQYTDLECFSAGTPIIINRKFYDNDGFDHKERVNCFVVKDAKEFVDLLPTIDEQSYADVVRAGFEEAYSYHVDNAEMQNMYRGMLE